MTFADFKTAFIISFTDSTLVASVKTDVELFVIKSIYDCIKYFILNVYEIH